MCTVWMNHFYPDWTIEAPVFQTITPFAEVDTKKQNLSSPFAAASSKSRFVTGTGIAGGTPSRQKSAYLVLRLVRPPGRSAAGERCGFCHGGRPGDAGCPPKIVANPRIGFGLITAYLLPKICSLNSGCPRPQILHRDRRVRYSRPISLIRF